MAPPYPPLWGGFVLPSLVFKFSPTHAHTRAGKPKNTQSSTPRPIELQRTAAQLIAHIPALKTGRHVGQICDVLDRAGIAPPPDGPVATSHVNSPQTPKLEAGYGPHNSHDPPRSYAGDWHTSTGRNSPPTERSRQNDQTRLAEQAARHRETRERDSHVAHAHTRAQIMRQLREQFSTRTPA